MKNKVNTSSDASSLRQRAEQKFEKETSGKTVVSTDADNSKLLHELQVHQIELEMQNEELSLAREKAETMAEKLTELYDFAPVGYFTLDHGGTILELNLRGAALLFLERSRLLNSNFRLFVTYDTLHVFDEFLQKVFGTTSRQICEVKLTSKEYSAIYVHIEGIISDEKNKCFVNVADISERMLAQEILESTLQHLKFLVENTPLAMVEFNNKFQITKWSDNSTKMFGWQADEVLGKSIEEFRWIHEEDAGRVASLFEAISAGKIPSNIHENKNYRKDGSVLTCEWYNSVLTDSDGKLISVQSLIHNITDRINLMVELEHIITKLEYSNSNFVGRELKMIELKKEINALLMKEGKDKKYFVSG